MTTLIKNLEKELIKSNIKSQKLELKYNNSKNEKNDFWGDDKIYQEMKKNWEITSILDVAITQLKRRN